VQKQTHCQICILPITPKMQKIAAPGPRALKKGEIDNRLGIRRSPLREVGGERHGKLPKKPKLPTKFHNFQNLPIPVLSNLLMGMDRAVLNMICNSDRHIKRNICDNVVWRQKYNELHPEGLFHTDTEFFVTRQNTDNLIYRNTANLIPVVATETTQSYLNNFTVSLTITRDAVGDVQDIHYFQNPQSHAQRGAVYQASVYILLHRVGINYRVFLFLNTSLANFLLTIGMQLRAKEFTKIAKKSVPLPFNGDYYFEGLKNAALNVFEASPLMAKKIYNIIKKKAKTIKKIRMYFI